MTDKPKEKQNPYKILRRDGFRCVYCGRSAFEDQVVLHVDHIVPFAKGGNDIARNLATACRDCNMAKHHILLPAETEKLLVAEIERRNATCGIHDFTTFSMIGRTEQERLIRDANLTDVEMSELYEQGRVNIVYGGWDEKRNRWERSSAAVVNGMRYSRSVIGIWRTYIESPKQERNHANQ